jgi:hypothetical protein
MSHIHRTHIRTRYTLNPALALIASLAFFHSARAANLYWDTYGTTYNFGTTASGPLGKDSFWSMDSTGTSVPLDTLTCSTDKVNFGSATSGFLTAAAVTISGTRSVGNSTFGARNTDNLTFGFLDGTSFLSLGSSSQITNNSNSILFTRIRFNEPGLSPSVCPK